MTEAELLSKVKIGLFGSDAGTWRDGMLTVYINEVRDFMQKAGVPAEKINSPAAVGCILIGVNDLWNYSGGGVRLSEYFKQRVIQFATADGDKS